MGQLLWDMVHNAWETYFPEMTFVDAIIAAVMLTAIFLADARNKPLKMGDLKKLMGMPRETTRVKIIELIDCGAITRDAKWNLHVNGTFLGNAKSLANVARIRNMIVKAAAALTRFGPPRSPKTGT